MAINETGLKFANEVIEALGLSNVKNIVDIDLTIHCEDVITVTVKYYPENDELDKLIPILKKYELKEKLQTKIKANHK